MNIKLHNVIAIALVIGTAASASCWLWFLFKNFFLIDRWDLVPIVNCFYEVIIEVCNQIKSCGQITAAATADHDRILWIARFGLVVGVTCCQHKLDKDPLYFADDI